MRFFIADAFTETLFGGNPAGVVLIDEDRDYPSDEVMVKTAAELRYSETAFIKKHAPGEFRARYFTPAAEVDLCGHATIASFYCLLRAGIISEGETCLVHTLSGDIEVSVTNGFVMMDMASPKHLGTIKDAVELDRLYEVMGSEYNQTTGLYPMMISTGLPDIMMPVASREELEELAPDMKALSKLSEDYNVVGVHAFTLDAEEGTTAHARNFAPLYDIDEEAATGTSNGALTYYLCLNQKIPVKAECRIVQGEKMGRPSVIRTSIDAGEVCRIKVGGSAVILAEGDIRI